MRAGKYEISAHISRMNGADRKNRAGELKDFFKISPIEKILYEELCGETRVFSQNSPIGKIQ